MCFLNINIKLTFFKLRPVTVKGSQVYLCSVLYSTDCFKADLQNKKKTFASQNV